MYCDFCAKKKGSSHSKDAEESVAVPGPAQKREEKVLMAVRATVCTASNAAEPMCGRWLRRAAV